MAPDDFEIAMAAYIEKNPTWNWDDLSIPLAMYNVDLWQDVPECAEYESEVEPDETA